MPLLEKHPPHVRKRFALLWTVGIALILIAVMLIVYIGKEGETSPSETSGFRQLYETISSQTQSFFSGN